ncbi:MAG: hypothetical protein OXG25_00040 [Gammaproteobacteria bacterium]|nr:hypothetical protein [Gammaproteobacteria bacterium]
MGGLGSPAGGGVSEAVCPDSHRTSQAIWAADDAESALRAAELVGGCD